MEIAGGRTGVGVLPLLFLRGAAARAVEEGTDRRVIQARQLGDVTYLNAGEAAKAAAINDTQLPRVWDLWTREAGSID